MATQLFLLDAPADVCLQGNHPRLTGTTGAWIAKALGTARGSSVVASKAESTTAGPVSGFEVADVTSNQYIEWISPPVSADVTISGTITANIWGRESANAANVAINVVIQVIRSNTLTTSNSNTLVTLVQSSRITEMAISATTNSVNNFTTGMTSGAYTGQTLNRGDRLRIRVFGDDAGTMGASQTFQIGFNGASAAADGDTYVSLTETLTFESAPAGSVLYLTDIASAVATSSVDREAWTSRDAGVQTDVTNTAAGWTAPIQVTDTAGGTVVDWFTRPLTAFTLGGMAVANLRALESVATANASLRCEIARVNNDGTNESVWGSWCMAGVASDRGELSTTEAARTANVSGDDLAVSDGQRLRIRVYIDDGGGPMGASQTVTFYYAGTSAAASGDSYITLPQTVTEYVAASPYIPVGFAVGRDY